MKKKNLWVSEQVWEFWSRENFTAFAENETAVFRASSRLIALPLFYFFLTKE
jgi:hypothetical protein